MSQILPKPGPMTPKTDLYMKVVAIDEPVILFGDTIEYPILLPEKDLERVRLFRGSIIVYEGVAVSENSAPFFKFSYWMSGANWTVKITLTFFGVVFDELQPLPVAQ